MFLNFLTAPQSSDEQIAGTSAAFARGAAIGADGAADAERAQADLAKQKEVSKAHVAATIATQRGETDRKLLDQTKKSNDDLFTTLHSGLAAKIADQQSKLESGNYDESSQSQLKSNIESNRALLTSLELHRQAQIATNPEGHHSYDEKYYSAPDTPTNLQLATEVKQSRQGKLASETYNGLIAEKNYTDPGWQERAKDELKGDKVTPKAEDTRDAFSATIDLLPTKAQRVVDATRALQQNPNDPAAIANQKFAVEDLQKAKDVVQTSWSGLVDRIEDGQFGKTAKEAFDSLSSKVPAGTDLTLVQNHQALQSAINDVLRPLAEKKRKSGLTPAEDAIAARYARLAQVLKADKDVVGALKASSFEGDNSVRQGTDLKSLKGTLPLPTKSAIDSVSNSRYGGAN